MIANSDRRLIVDTDPGVDDAIALVMALTAEGVTVDGVTVVAGNVDFVRQVANAQYVLELTGTADTVPVHEGARSPLAKDHETDEGFHGETGLGEVSAPEGLIDTADGHAVDRIVEAARTDPGAYTLVCLGPLTNLALALQREPELGDLLADVWVMGGTRRTGGSGSPAAEFNFWVDPDAAKIVLDSLTPTLVTWDLSTDAGFLPGETFTRIRSRAGEAGFHEFLRDTTQTPREVTKRTEGVDGFVAADALLMGALLDPEMIESFERKPVAVDARPGLTRGYLAVDEYGAEEWPGSARFVTDVDSERFRTRVVDAFASGDPFRSMERRS